MPKKKQNKAALHDVLVLNKYILSLFGVKSLEALADDLRGSQYEGYTKDNTSKFYHQLVTAMYANDELDAATLRGYDQNIISHTQAISERRVLPIGWKYFQYLSLLFTEIYLDRWFRNPAELLRSLNDFVDKFNDPLQSNFADGYNPADWQAEYFEASDLRKLAFWNATGSGKTLLMHVHIKQYLHYLKANRKDGTLNKIILITPNEGLTTQHLKEFNDSGIIAAPFRKERAGQAGMADLFAGRTVEVIDIHKLEDKAGDKTVAVDSFEENNLVLIDEAHRGINGTEWKRKRDQLSNEGFAFEYSATFSQAIAASNSRKGALTDYSKITIFDYSYKYFHRDGYGKDFEILNLEDTSRDAAMHKYLVACLLTFYQQLVYFEENEKQITPFLIHKPLCIFVGGSVTSSLSKKEATDIQKIIGFIARFVKDSQESIDILEQLMQGADGLEDKNRRLVFGNKFKYLYDKNLTGQQLYRKILSTIFNSTTDGGQLHLLNLKGQKGELGLRVGQGEYFGVINVSDDAKLLKQCAKAGISTNDDEFATSIFKNLNERGSTANMLIGAKKFTEGWSSWRVSMMGLMNIGRSEGSQIIQLFGRGVRLKGYNFSLKRSNRLDQHERPDYIPKYLPILETLNVFGIKSDYMALFKQFLEEEGINTEQTEQIEIKTTVLPTVQLDKHNLKLVRVQEGRSFKKEKSPVAVFEKAENHLHVTLDWYPKIDVTRSKEERIKLGEGESERGFLEAKHTAFFDWSSIYFALQKFKNERNWYNASFTKADLQNIFKESRWYTLYIPHSEMQLRDFEQVFVWQEIAVTLLKSYFERAYNYYKQEYLSQYLESFVLDSNHANLREAEQYVFEIERSQQRIITELKKIKTAFESSPLPSSEMKFGKQSSVFTFGRHIYQPLVWFSTKQFKNLVSVKPLQLNSGERDFINDLKKHHETQPDFFADKELFVLRNMSRKGVGFFAANNFYPDFILWILHEGKQYVSFVDPKGLRQVEGFEDPKIQFKTNIKTKVQDVLSDDNLILNSFIVSVTEFRKVPWRSKKEIEDFNAYHIFFQQEQKEGYVSSILRKCLS